MDKKQIRTIVIAAVIIVIGIVASIYIFSQKDLKINSLQTKQEMLNKSINEKDSLVNELESTFNEIESNIQFIKEKRAELSIKKNDESQKDHAQVVNDVKMMNQMLEESSKKIDELQDKLKKSGLNLRSFERRVAQMSKDIKAQNEQIADLQKQINQKTTQVNQLTGKVSQMSDQMNEQSDTINSQKQRLDEKTTQLNSGHIIYGTYKELKDKGIISKEGGILGIGSSKTIASSFDENYFTTVNIQETTKFPLHVKKAKLITDHPGNSYKLVEEGNEIAYLEITNPKEFWKITKYAVIEIK